MGVLAHSHHLKATPAKFPQQKGCLGRSSLPARGALFEFRYSDPLAHSVFWLGTERSKLGLSLGKPLSLRGAEPYRQPNTERNGAMMSKAIQKDMDAMGAHIAAAPD